MAKVDRKVTGGWLFRRGNDGLTKLQRRWYAYKWKRRVGSKGI